MSNSSLATYTHLLPYTYGTRGHAIDRITPHCWAGHGTLAGFQSTAYSRSISANYAIDDNGNVGLFVDESKAAWSSSDEENDRRAVTIECASDSRDPCEMYAAVYHKLVELCADICRRNGKTKLLWPGSKSAALAYESAADEMVLTAHRWFENKSCPGDWLYSRFGDLAEKVTALLDGKSVSYNDSAGTADTSQQITIASVNDGKDYLVDETAAAMFGKIWHTETFDGITDPSALKTAGEKWLEKQRGIKATVEISAVDLHAVDVSISAIRVGRTYPVRISPVVTMEDEPQAFECKKASIDLLNPAGSRFAFGTVRNTLTGRLGKLQGAGRSTAAASVVASDADAQIRRLDEILSADVGDVNALISALTARVETLENGEETTE